MTEPAKAAAHTAGPTIKLTRVERDCDYNRDVRSGKVKDHPIYDWRILIDGEYRAQFRPGTYRGYNVYDPDGFHIKIGDRSMWARRSDVSAKAEFETSIRGWMERGLIPTLNQIEEARSERLRKRDADKAEREEATRAQRIRDAAPAMLAALKALDGYWTEDFPEGPDVHTTKPGCVGPPIHESTAEIWRGIRAAIARAESQS